MQLDALFDHLHALPSVPKVAQELITQLDNPNTSVDKLARNLALDPVISAKVLRLANTPRFRGARESTSVEDAAMRLGFNTLRTLVLASAVTGAFQKTTHYDPRDFWQQSFDVASVCRVLARLVGADAETAFTCGMLHNIGELLIQTAAPDIAPRIRSSSATGRAADETLQLGFGYPEVGAELARRWQFPTLIQDAIAFQARPLQAPMGAPLPLIIAQATLVSEALRQYGGVTAESRQAVDGPLMTNVDLDALFKLLPSVLEADKAFGELIN